MLQPGRESLRLPMPSGHGFGEAGLVRLRGMPNREVSVGDG
jgi:hypothetical protein